MKRFNFICHLYYKLKIGNICCGDEPKKVAILCQVGEVALSILHNMVAAHSDMDDAGELVTPTPRVKSILSSPRCLPHIAQVFLIVLVPYILYWKLDFQIFHI